ncbi:hypothetical protein D3C77_392310 [compost metagenome]
MSSATAHRTFNPSLSKPRLTKYIPIIVMSPDRMTDGENPVISTYSGTKQNTMRSEVSRVTRHKRNRPKIKLTLIAT